MEEGRREMNEGRREGGRDREKRKEKNVVGRSSN